MNNIILTILVSTVMISAENFTLKSNDLEGQLNKSQEFNSFGCSGENKSPQFHWKDAPKGTKSFALTVYDPDAPTGSGWWHWLVVNIPSHTNMISSDASAQGKLPKGAVETMTDYGSTGFGGACPPSGDKDHMYIFTLYALDVEKLDVNEKSDSALVGYMINQHALGKSSLVSYYGRP